VVKTNFTLQQLNGRLKSLKNSLVTRTGIAASVVVVLVAASVCYFSVNGTFDVPDPQEMVGVSWIKPVGSEAAFAGSKTCADCHARESRSYFASPHSRTLHRIAAGEERPEFAAKQTVTDDLNGVRYSLRKGEGKNQVVAASGGGANTEVGEARWVFGSGTRARTYLTQNDSGFLQLRVTYYPPAKMWNFTPGSGPGAPYHEALGDPYSPAQAAACFGCHTTVLTGTRKSLDLTHSLLNVGCESCHGAARNHVDSATGDGAGQLVTPRLHNGPQIMQLCSSCHRMPVATDDAKPMGASESQLARFPGVALVRSRCFIASAGKLSCITCHNPHQSTEQQKPSSFESKCLSCHSTAHQTTCSEGKKSGCINCHMPQESVAGRLPLRFHNHWIRKDPFEMT